jgi:hypothetical protein
VDAADFGHDWSCEVMVLIFSGFRVLGGGNMLLLL